MPVGLRVVTATDLRSLAQQLARTLREHPLPPLQKECVVVQSLGMRRWLTLQLARHLGCAAQLDLPLPARFATSLAKQIFGEDIAPERGAFSREVLVWRILTKFETLIDRPAFAMLRKYLGEQRRGKAYWRKAYQLASRIADVLDNYQLYRTEMLQAWARGETLLKDENETWQAALWEFLVDESSELHTGACLQKLLFYLREDSPRDDHSPGDERVFAEDATSTKNDLKKCLPQRLTVFGINTLPPVFVELLDAIAKHVDVTVYLVRPTAEPVRNWLRDYNRGPSGVAARGGNPLLHGMARQCYELFLLLQKKNAAWQEETSVPVAGKGVLHALQRDLRNNAERGTTDAPVVCPASDLSLQIHSTHSAFREMEVLRDQILHAFETLPGLKPDDVLILVPDISAYAPLIEAVFGVPHEGTPETPYEIVDRRHAQTEQLADAVLQVLALSESRVTARELLQLLDCPAMRRAAGLHLADLPIITDWIARTNIYWGVDGQQRSRDFDVPALDATTWRAGLDRLLLGYATGPVDVLVGQTKPEAEDTIGRAEVLGKFAVWCDRLFTFVEQFKTERPLLEWTELLLKVLDDLFEPSEAEAFTLQMYRDAVEPIRAESAGVDFSRPVSVSLLSEHLKQAINDERLGASFINGKMTFCEIKPLRTIPFRVIALCGMNERVFPRMDRRPLFDLQAVGPAQLGDRNLRKDDRQLFLEILLAAKDRLLMTYVGRSAKDNKEKAASTLVSEVLDYIEKYYRLSSGGAVGAQVFRQHPLQPFSEEYFSKNSRFFSYSQANVKASVASRAESNEGAPFVEGPVAQASSNEIVLEDLVRFWLNPARFYCQNALGLRLDDRYAKLEDHEPFGLDALQRYQLNERLVQHRLQREGLAADEEKILMAEGAIPLAGLGESYYLQLREQVQEFVSSLGTPHFIAPLSLTLHGKGWVLSGVLEQLTASYRLQFRCAQIKPNDLLSCWIQHLVLNAYAQRTDSSGPQCSTVVGRDGAFRFEPLEHADTYLTQLIDGFQQGANEPLPFFNRASFAYVEQEIKAQESKRIRTPPLKRAEQEFAEQHGDFGGRGDRDDPYVALAFRGRQPLADDVDRFTAWATTVWRPIFEHRKAVTE